VNNRVKFKMGKMRIMEKKSGKKCFRTRMLLLSDANRNMFLLSAYLEWKLKLNSNSVADVAATRHATFALG